MHSELFRIFGLPVMSYGLMMVVGFALGIWRATRISQKRYGIAPDRVYDIALVVLFAGVLGGRLLYVLLDPTETWSHFFAVWDGGLSFHGGFVASLLLGWVYTKLAKIPFWDALDMVTPSVAVAYACTRIGCFLNGCCYGGPTTLPWGVKFEGCSQPMHPTQLYGALASLLIFFILVRIERLNRASGLVFMSYMGLYGVYRFLVEFLRAGYTANYWRWGLTQAQAVSVVMIVISVIGVCFFLSRRQIHSGN